MKGSISLRLTWKLAIQVGLLVLFIFNGSLISAQVLAVNTIQNLSFGTFSQGEIGGTITVSNAGVTTTTGTVVPLTFGGINDVLPAIFEVEAPVGTVISVSNGPDANLAGSNGGTMNLHLGSSSPVTPFTVVNQTGRTSINIGGTLTIGNQSSTPPGVYSGTFYITINNE